MMKTILFAVFFFLFSTVAILAGEPEWVERRVGDLGVMLPSGNGWEVTEFEPGIWGTVRQRQTRSGDPEFLDMAVVVPQGLPEMFHDWLPVEVATDYLSWEVENMRIEGVDKGIFDLIELDVYEEPHGAFTLHVLRNVKNYIKPWHPMLKLEAQELYLVFLPNFAESLIFYKIFISADCFFEGCEVDDLGLSEMYPLLDDLRDYSAVSD